jgi:hypothetical protein
MLASVLFFLVDSSVVLSQCSSVIHGQTLPWENEIRPRFTISCERCAYGSLCVAISLLGHG